MPQRSRPPLKPSLKPSDDLPCLQPIHNPLYQLLLVIKSLIANALLFQELFDLLRTMFLSPVRMLHAKLSWPAHHHMIGIEGCSDCPTAVTGRWLHVQFLKRRLPKDSAVRHAIERHTAGHAKPLQACLLVRMLSHLQQDLFRHRLNTCRNVGVMLILLPQFAKVRRLFSKIRGVAGRRREKVRLGIPWGTKKLQKFAIKCLLSGAMKGEVVHIEFEAAITIDPDQLVHLVDISGRPKGSHPHHLVFAFIDLKAQEGGKGTVE